MCEAVGGTFDAQHAYCEMVGVPQADVDAAKLAAKLEGMKEMCETVGGTFDASTCTLPETTAPGKASGEGCYNDDECASGSCGGSCGGPCTNSPSHVHYCL